MSDGWTEVTKTDSDVWDRSAPLTGVLMKKETNVGPNESMMYTIKTDDGNVSVWGSTVIDTKFEEIPVGFMVKIEPLGKVKSEGTGREYLDFKVLYKPFEGFEAGETPQRPPKVTVPDPIIEDIGDEPINLDDIPF